MATALATHEFPVDVLEGCETALVLFAAAFGGAQDAAFIRDAGLRAVCVDTNDDALAAMTSDYPPDWHFATADAFSFCGWPIGEPWDVVTLDPFCGDMMDRTIDHLPDFCKLARKAVICGTDGRQLRPPVGWRVRSKMWRTSHDGGVYWTVLVPA